MSDSPLIAATFYAFVALPDAAALQPALLACCVRRRVKGTILVAMEGINGTIAGAADDVQAVLDWLRGDPRLARLEHKQSPAAVQPFHRMKVRLKREIVTLGVPGIDPATMAGTYVAPADWNALIDDPEVLVIDVRNDYEVAIGSFDGALNPRTTRFSELPAWLAGEDALKSRPKVAMFCTGGIRCEKSTAYLRSLGHDEVFHLQGGILKYLETVPEAESRWRGECFVFDERVAVGHGLAPGHYALCRACRRPIGEDDVASPLYVAGVSCPHCHDRTSDGQKLRYAERQRQSGLAGARQQVHVGARMPAGAPICITPRHEAGSARILTPGYSTRTVSITVGDRRFRVRALSDLQQFADPDGQAEQLGISSAQWSLFGQVWPAGRVLAEAMATHDVDGKRVLELGCGLGLASLVLKARGVDVTASDHHPLARSFLQYNAALNQLPAIAFHDLPWTVADAALGRFDLIIGSDILYERDHAALLAALVARHANDRCEVMIADPGRNNSAAFARALAAQGYGVTESRHRMHAGELPPYRGRLLHCTRAATG